MANHYSVRRIDEKGRIANDAASWHADFGAASKAKDEIEAQTGDAYIVGITRGEAIRRSNATLERCETARLPDDEARPARVKRTITVEIACSRWHCDGCHLLDPKEKLCDAFPGELLVSKDERYLRCDPCLERDQLSRADTASEVCTECDFIQDSRQCSKLNVTLNSIWRASVGRINLRTKTCRLHRMKVVKGQRESEE